MKRFACPRLPTSIAAPAAVVAVGWTQTDNPASIAAVVIAAPAMVVLLGWLSLSRASVPKSPASQLL